MQNKADRDDCEEQSAEIPRMGHFSGSFPLFFP